MQVIEEERVAPYGCLSKNSLGRSREHTAPDIRSEFQRDRDRIIYSHSFYRLSGKTQVFMTPNNPYVSNRMTHTLQVAQIARTIARAVGLNEDLVEAIGLGHDAGHPPFGHRGEMVLDRLCRKYMGYGFKHHIQSVVMLERVERQGQGLNLTYEVKDGIICHSGEDKGGEVTPSKEATDLNAAITKGHFIPRQPYTLEGCVVKLCDKISYVGKDIEDAISSGLIERSDIPEECAKALGNTNGEIIGTLVNDIIDNFNNDVAKFKKEHGRLPHREDMKIRMSPDKAKALDTLIFDFNYKNIYLNKTNIRYSEQTEGIVKEIFERYLKELWSLKRTGMNIPLSKWNFDPTGHTARLYTESVRTIEAMLSDLEPGKWGTIEPMDTDKVVREVGEEDAAELLKDIRQLIIQDNAERYSGGTSSILFFLRGMKDDYIRNEASPDIARNALVSMTDDMALSTFEAMRIPKPIV